MLLIDGSPNDLEALRVYESAILEVANTEGIDLAAKMCLATEEISQDILDVLLGHPVSDPKAVARRVVQVDDVVVTRQLKRWHAAQTLEVVYRDAFNNQLNDRYSQKAKEYDLLAADARSRTLSFGIGLSMTPIPRALPPVVTFVDGANAATIYYVQVSWLAGDQEGEPSAMTTAEVQSGSLPVVAAQSPPPGATGFNVFMGLGPIALTLQNTSPIAIGGSFTLTTSEPTAGRAPGHGQVPDVFVSGGSVTRRG